MKLAKPITFTFTQQTVGMPIVDLDAGYIRIPVTLSTESGMVIRRDVVLDRPSEVTAMEEVVKEHEVDGPNGKKIKVPQRVSEPVKRTLANCQRLAINPVAATPETALRVEQFEHLKAFENARRALKEDDEIAALEAAGIADGWLFPVATKPTKEEK